MATSGGGSMTTDLEVDDRFSAVEVPQSNVALSALLTGRRGRHEVPVGRDDERRAGVVRRHAPHVLHVVTDVVGEGPRPRTSHVDDDDVAAGGGVDEQQGERGAGRRRGQLQQAPVLVERHDGTARARRHVPHVDAEAADVAVAAVARREAEVVLDENESDVARHRHTVHRSFVHLPVTAHAALKPALPPPPSSSSSSLFSARCNIYISRLCYDVSVRLSVRLSVCL